MEHVLITGGSGFLGSHLCEELLREGASVECVDNFLTGTPANVSHLLRSSAFTLVEHDITRPLRPRRTPTAVLHLASPASPPAYLANPIPTLAVGSAGTMNALDIAVDAGARFLLASTSEVYGDPDVDPQPESYRGNVSTTGPRGVYDEAKRFAEAVTSAYHREHGLETRIARIFNSYGPRMAPYDGRAVPTFVRQALNGEPLTVYGNGSQTRSLCFVDDTVRGLLALLRSDVDEPVNVGNPEERTVLDVARTVVATTGSDSQIIFEPLPVDDPKVRCPDITRARELLGWEPAFSFEDGLARSLPWFRSAVTGTLPVSA
jgi:dTDP-glucose 4,6-dehydratase